MSVRNVECMILRMLILHILLPHLCGKKVQKTVDKSAITGTEGWTMADDPSFAAPPSHLKQLDDDPACDAHTVWKRYRHDLHRFAAAAKDEEEVRELLASLSFDLLSEHLPADQSIDSYAHTCFFGLITALYILGSHRVRVEREPLYAIATLRTLDFYASTIHPDTFDIRISGIWPVTSEDIETLRRDMARALMERDPIPGESPIRYFGFDHNETFTVYVYSPEEVPELKPLIRGGSFCKNTQWGAEVQLHQYFLQSKTFTNNSADADFFFVPQYTACHLNLDTFTREQSDELFKKLIRELPYFAKTQGRDHIFAFTSGMAVDGPFPSWRKYIKDSIFLMAETELWNRYSDVDRPSFSVHKDIVIPGMTSLSALKAQQKMAAPMNDKSWVGDFVGWNRPLHPSDDESDSPRERLLQMANNTDLHIRQDVPGTDALFGAGNSIFCFIPRGISAWSSRLFRTMFADCIPVLLNDYYEVPFSEFLDVHEWLIKWPMKDLDGPLLLSTLQRLMNNGIAILMLHALKATRCWYVFPPSIIDEEFSEIELTLEELCPQWRTQNAFLGIMQLLRRKVRVTKNSPGTFFFPQKYNLVFTDRNFNILY